MRGLAQLVTLQREARREVAHIFEQPACACDKLQPQLQAAGLIWRRVPGVSAIRLNDTASSNADATDQRTTKQRARFFANIRGFCTDLGEKPMGREAKRFCYQGNRTRPRRGPRSVSRSGMGKVPMWFCLSKTAHLDHFVGNTKVFPFRRLITLVRMGRALAYVTAWARFRSRSRKQA
jgi:hypothetical protein